MMSKFEVWGGPDAFYGFRITFGGGKVLNAGRVEFKGEKVWNAYLEAYTWRGEGIHKSYEFQDGETLTSLIIWSNRARNRVGAIKFTTSLGEEVMFQSELGPSGSEMTFEVYSGILCGMYGRWHDEIDAIGFDFLKTIESAELHGIQYSKLENTPAHSMRITKIECDQPNDSAEKQTHLYSESTEVTTSNSWKNTDTRAHNRHGKIGLKASGDGCNLFYALPKDGEEKSPPIPKVDLTVECGYSWTTTTVDEESNSEAKSEKKSLQFSYTAPPHSYMSAAAVIVEDTIDLQYKGLWTVTFRNGGSHTFNVKGIYKGVSSRRAIKTVTPADGFALVYPLTWRKCRPDNYPKGINTHGYDTTGECFYVARVIHEDCVIPGKFGPHNGGYVYTFGYSTWLDKNFEILVVDHLQLLWMHVAGALKGPQGPCPKGYALLSAGHDGKGNTFYVGRTYIGGGLNIGKTGFHMGGMEYTVYKAKKGTGNIRTTGNYEVLCAKGGFQLISE